MPLLAPFSKFAGRLFVKWRAAKIMSVLNRQSPGISRLIVSRPTLIVGIIIFLLDLDRR